MRGLLLLDFLRSAFLFAAFFRTTGLQSAGFLLTPDAFLTPVIDGHLLNEEVLDGGLGLEFVAESLQERGELFARFAFEDDSFGEESVAKTVAGGFALAFGRGRAVGLGPLAPDAAFCFSVGMVVEFELFVSWLEN